MMHDSYKIYFSGSISGGRQDSAIYHRIITHLQQYGRVLTDHIGDPDLDDAGEPDMGDEAVYRRDINWIAEADIFVAEVTNPSLGVGYELARAQQRGKPVLCLYRHGATRRLSAMIAGNPDLMVRRYEQINEVFPLIDRFFETYLPDSHDQEQKL